MVVRPRFRTTYLIVALAGVAAAVITAVGGVLLERRRFGVDDRDALARIERELVQQFNRSGAMLAASLIAGALWDLYGPAATFLAGAAITAAALVGFGFVRATIVRGTDGAKAKD